MACADGAIKGYARRMGVREGSRSNLGGLLRVVGKEATGEWEVVIHNSGGLPTDHHFTIVIT